MTETTTTPFDAADHLKTDEARLEYLRLAMQEALDENDPGLFTDALNTVARSGNVSDLAKKAGLSRAGVYKALSADNRPAFDTVARIVGALGYRIQVTSAG